jgi:hypothetical protein
MRNQLLEAALGISKPSSVRDVDFDAARKALTIGIDSVVGSRFRAPAVDGAHRRGRLRGTGRGLNGLFRATKRDACSYTRFATTRTVRFLIASKFGFTPFNPRAA